MNGVKKVPGLGLPKMGRGEEIGASHILIEVGTCMEPQKSKQRQQNNHAREIMGLILIETLNPID